MHKLLKSPIFVLIIIFSIGVLVRFWWFPNNVYFGFDQSRDAFISQNIFKNSDFKIIGPSAGKEDLFHGPLYWYLIGPIYLLFKGDPMPVLGFISTINLGGVLAIYFIARRIFNLRTAVISALLFAVSFSQSQYSLYFANPAPAILTILLYYFSLWSMREGKARYWLFAGILLGLSIQFEFFLIYPAKIQIFRKPCDAKNPAVKSKLSPGRKKPSKSPLSAKTMPNNPR